MPLLRVALLLAVSATLALAGRVDTPVVGLPCEGCEAVFDGLPAAPAAHARIAAADEPGQPLQLSGRVLDAQGAPREGVIVYAYQTNASGIYPRDESAQGGAARRHGRLRGWARSDAQGRYAFDTIRPGAYPGRGVPEHIHLHVIEPGCATYYIDDVLFTDDPLLDSTTRASMDHGRGGSGVLTPVREGERWLAVRDIHLGRRIAGYPGCG